MNHSFDKLKFKISYDQWIVLEHIKENQGINQVKLCKLTAKRPASVCRILKKLHDFDLILKISNEENKRANKLYLSHNGVDLANKISSVYHTQLDQNFEGIYERELSLIKEVLSRIENNYLKLKSAKS